MAWTDFELVRLSVSKIKRSFPGRACVLELENVGVPRGFFGRRYTAGKVEMITVRDGRLVCFGSTGLKGRICLEPSSGEVVEFLDLGKPSSSSPVLVNSSLAFFTKTVQSAIARFPYYSASDSSETKERVSAALGEVILEIDRRAMDRGRFWATFVDDVAMGDFATESVLGRSKAARRSSRSRRS